MNEPSFILSRALNKLSTGLVAGTEGPGAPGCSQQVLMPTCYHNLAPCRGPAASHWPLTAETFLARAQAWKWSQRLCH